MNNSSNSKSSSLSSAFSELENFLTTSPNDSQTRSLTPDPVNIANNAAELTSYVHSLYDKVITEDLKTKIANPLLSYTLPHAIPKNIGGKEQLIIIDSIIFTPGGAFLNAAASIEFPGENSKRIGFYGSRIGFHKGGISGPSNIFLTQDLDLDIIEDKVKLIFKGDKMLTFVDFDCNGLKTIGIDADIEFSRDMLLPVDGKGSILPGNEKVTASITTELTDLSELLISTNISPFQVVGLEDYVFKIHDASLDLSDIANPAGLVFPHNYPEENTPLWRGFLLKKASVTLPPCFKKTSGVLPVLSASDIIIDNNGITGFFNARDLIPLDEGSMSGWQFSLNNIDIELFTGSLQKCNFAGEIILPICDSSDKVAYSGEMDFDGKYYFSLNSLSDIDVPIWKANLELAAGSELGILIENDEFKPHAILNGNISINDKGGKLDASGLSFQELKLQTVTPYVSAKAVSLTTSSQSKTSGFPVSIKKVSFLSNADDIGIGFTATLNLTGKGNGNFGANTSLEIWAQPKNTKPGILGYEYKEINVGDIGVNIDGGAFRLSGSLMLYDNDSIYGKGFSGQLSAWFEPGISVDVGAQFGNVNNYRYWYADALVGFPTGIPIFSGVGIYGFGGGASMHMKRAESQSLSLSPETPKATIPQKPPPGLTSSGVLYVPDNTVGLGLRAKVIVGTMPSPKVFNGDVGLELIFKTGGGLSQLSMDGSASFMSEIGAPNDEKPLFASVHMTYDVTEKTFFAESSVYINVANGVVKGNGPNNLAGSSEMYFSNDNWYINIGTIPSRIDISILNTVSLNGYFMTGKTLPPMPDLDPKITRLLNREPTTTRSVMSQSGGAGFAFGAALNMNTGEKTFGPFYANFESTIGFDIMMKNLGGMRCNGKDGAVGINGWYAAGQSYAYFLGDIGLQVNMPFYSGRYQVLQGEFGAVLQAQLPNPTWMLGEIGGNYNILNGLISGECNFSIEIGEQCQISGLGAMAGTSIISELTPTNNETEVSVYNAPQAVFNMPIDQIFSFEEMDGTRRSMKIVLENFVLSSNDQFIQGDIEWNSNHDVASFKSHEILPPKAKVKAYVMVKFKELINGRWEVVYGEDGEAMEEKECNFTVGTAPPYIDPNNILYAYPIDKQKNLYKNESSNGYIVLNQGRLDLFTSDPKWQKVVRYTSNGNVIETDLSYNNSNNTVSFNLPSNLNNSSIYNLQIVKKPLIKVSSNDQNVSDESQNISSEEGGTINANIKKAEGTIDYFEEDELYNAVFATSIYNTFSEKVNNLNLQVATPWFLGTSDIYSMIAKYQPDEYFDTYEINGSGINNETMIRLELDNKNTWFNKNIYPLVYENLPISENIDLPDARKTDIYGIPPVKAGYFYQSNDNKLQDAEIQSNTISQPGGHAHFNYLMPRITYDDYYQLRSQCAGYYLNSKDPALRDIIETEYTNPLRGNYVIKLSYFLPGKKEPSSVENLTMNFQF